MVLTGKKIFELGYIKNIGSIRTQIQPTGIDLRLKNVYCWSSPITLSVNKHHNKTSKYTHLPWIDDQVVLSSGGYFIEFIETIEVPLNAVAVIYPRSTLMRSGISLNSSYLDPGYIGPLAANINQINPHQITIHRGVRIAQCMFMTISEKLKQGYQGYYQKKSII